METAYHLREVVDFNIVGRQDRNKIKTQLRQHARLKRTVLIVPLLASEFTDPVNRPVMENILDQLGQVSYLHKIIFGLDAAGEDQAHELNSMINKAKIKNSIIQWNSGPVFADFYSQLTDAGFGLTEDGKGKNMFLSFGLALALDAQCIGIVDADIRGFDRIQLDRLLYPVVVCNYDFCKSYYIRASNRRLYGRVKRLLLVPLLLSLKRKFLESGEKKMLGLIDFILQFRYPLSGEVAFEHDLLRKMRFATNWGVEIFTLIEVYRKASSVAQVEFTQETFDHKHQDISEDDDTKGLNRMAVDIVTTFLNTLVREEGLEMTEHFFRDLSVTYRDVAEHMIKIYAEQAAFNGLLYDRDDEEHLTKKTFRNAILRAGELMTAQSRMTENFLRLIHSHREFAPFVEAGLADAFLAVEAKLNHNIFEIPQTVSWERVENKLPSILAILKTAIHEEMRRFA
ncbi:MAG: hypothetical protein QMD09_10835 [Desulfatibacillaceae bacterium]|nr:hypothetical protein [Desulfatibacillaceae bacterium]